MDDFPVDKSITFECDHRVCRPCFVDYTTDLILTRQVADH
jgi:hypothetical protein